MKEKTAELVYPVFNYGLELKERVERGESPDFQKEQANLISLIKTRIDPTLVPAWTGDSGFDPGVTNLSMRRVDAFLGIRYAMTCWLDELFILIMDGTEWAERWKDHALEWELYKSNDRAERFWEQAERVQTKGADEKEVFLLCVMLGFRGKYRDQPPEHLRHWVSATQAGVASALDKMEKEMRLPEAVPFPANVPPLRGREAFRKMILTLAALVLVGIFVSVLAVMRLL